MSWMAGVRSKLLTQMYYHGAATGLSKLSSLTPIFKVSGELKNYQEICAFNFRILKDFGNVIFRT